MNKWKMLPVVLAAVLSVPAVAQGNDDQKIQQDIQKQLSKDRYKGVTAQVRDAALALAAG